MEYIYIYTYIQTYKHTLHCIALYYNTIQYIALDHITLHTIHTVPPYSTSKKKLFNWVSWCMGYPSKAPKKSPRFSRLVIGVQHVASTTRNGEYDTPNE